RTAIAGTQRFPLKWSRDYEGTFEAMAEDPRGGSSLGISGFAYWSVDNDGFEGIPDAGVYKKWTAFSFLCSHSHLYGSTSVIPFLFSLHILTQHGQLTPRPWAIGK